MSSSDVRKKVGGRPVSKIWEWFIKGDQVSNSKGYYSATCSFCEYQWNTAKPAKLKKHLVYECKKVDSETRISALMMLANDCAVDSDDDHDDTTSISTRSMKSITKTNKK